VIRESGPPVIIVPHEYDGPEIGNNIVLGWSDTREAARTAHDLPNIANKGAEVTVLRVGSPTKDVMKDSGGFDLMKALSRHGLTTTLETRDAHG